MSRLNIERQKELEPKRLQYAIDQLAKLKIEVSHKTETSLQFTFRKVTVILYPYSGYFSGKGIQPGRGISELIYKLKKLPQ